MAKYILVIDQGGQSTRAIVFNKKGEPIAYSSEPVDDAITGKTNNHIEYDIDRIVAATETLLQRLLEQLSPEQVLKIKSVVLIAQRSSIVACDKNGKALTQMISWQDTRNAEWLDNQAFEQKTLQQLTGLRNNPHMGASKIRWLLDNDETIIQHANNNSLMFMPWGAYFLQRLIKNKKKNNKKNIQLITDPILAARTGLVEYQQDNWSPILLKLYKISENYLPKIVPTTYQYGEMNVGDSKIPVTLLGGDQNFIPCAYGMNKIKRNIFVNMGTGAFIQAYTKKIKPHRLLKTGIALEKNKSINFEGKHEKSKEHKLAIIEGTVNGAASALDWWQAQLPRPFSYTEIDQIIDRNMIAPIFINTFSGSGSPYWLKAKTPLFLPSKNSVNKSNITDFSEEEKTLAVIESILFACKINIDIICQQNKKLNNVIISGGLARSDAICQTLANLSEMSIERYDDSEASARGVIFYIHHKKKYNPSNPPTLFLPNTKTEKNNNLKKRFLLYCQEMEKLVKPEANTPYSKRR